MNEHLAGVAVCALCDITKGFDNFVIMFVFFYFLTTEQEKGFKLFFQAFSHFWGRGLERPTAQSDAGQVHHDKAPLRILKMRYPSRAAGAETVKMPYLQFSNSLFKNVHQSFVKPSVGVFERVGNINSQVDKTEEKYRATEGVREAREKPV